jgi:putative transposase
VHQQQACTLDAKERHLLGAYPARKPAAERLCRTLQPNGVEHYLFESIAEVQEHGTRWIWTYNHERPNTALGGITPKQKLARVA